MIPGRALHRLAAGVCSAKTLERVVEPAIADLQKEYAAAGVSRAWILLLGYAAILKVIAICALSVSFTAADERRAVMRALAWSAAMVVVILVLLMVPPLYSHPSIGWKAATTLVPQAMALAIPIGIAFGLAFGLTARPTMELAKATLIAAVAASALSFAILAWAVPAANEAFRNITFRELRARGWEGHINELQKGHSEMTLSELRGWEAHFAADGVPRRARQFRFAFHLRFALAAATLALVSVLLAVPVNHRGRRGALAFAACFTYWVLLFVGELGSRREYLPVPIGAWLPNLVLIASAILIALSSDSSRLQGPAEAGHYR